MLMLKVAFLYQEDHLIFESLNAVIHSYSLAEVMFEKSEIKVYLNEILSLEKENDGLDVYIQIQTMIIMESMLKQQEVRNYQPS